MDNQPRPGTANTFVMVTWSRQDDSEGPLGETVQENQPLLHSLIAVRSLGKGKSRPQEVGLILLREKGLGIYAGRVIL